MTAINYQRRVASDAPDEYKQAAYRAAREEVGCQLLDLLCKEKNPAIVEITEEIHPGLDESYDKDTYSFYGRADLIIIRIKIKSVEYQQVVTYSKYAGDFAYIRENKMTLLDRVKAAWKKVTK